MESLRGTGVVVTGGGGGIGAALARRFVAEGARVVVNDLDAAKATRVAEEIGAVAVPGDASTAVPMAREALGGTIDTFCANAGVAPHGGPEAGEELWESAWDVNVMAHVRAARELVPDWLERGRGRFVATVSAAGILTMLGSAPYSVTKHAALAFAEWLSVTYRHRGIDVHAVCPQGVRTDMLDSTGPAGDLVLAETAIEPEAVADALFEAMEQGRFLVLPHPETAGYYTARASAPDHWLAGMNKMQRKLEEVLEQQGGSGTLTVTYEDKPWLAQLNEAQRAPVNPPETILHAFREAVHAVPDRVALAYFDGRLSYAEVDTLSDGVAAHLAARGLERGDRLALMLQNSPHFVLALLGAWKAGATVVPVNPMYKAGEVAHVLADADVTALVCADRAWEDWLRATAGASPVRIALTACELDLQSRHDKRVLNFERAAPADDADDLLTVGRRGGSPPRGREPTGTGTALISYTSGTSGAPKGAMNTHANIAYNAERQHTGLELPDGACIFVLAPLFHITGMVCELASCIRGRGTLALAYRFEAGVVLDAFMEHRPAFTVGPSTAYMALAARTEATREHFSSFRVLSSGGAPVPPALVEKLGEAFGPYLRNGYGLTECTAPCASVPPGRRAPVDTASGTLAVGVPGPDTVVRIVDDEGRPVPLGEQGEITVRGPQVIPGYWRRPEESAAAIPDGELHTGDIGFMDADGWLYVVDRKKDMINASGFKVWPREVEDVLYSHPAVREAAVVGVPDAYRGESVRAYVSLRPGASAGPGELVGHCKDRLAAYKYPREIEILPELPKTASGKILRRELRSSGDSGNASGDVSA